MDQITKAGQVAQHDDAQRNSDLDPAASADLRKLSELELVLASGGDGAVYWP